MDFNALTAFLAVVDTGSTSLAAEQLFITQPAVSKRIASLEQTLNTRLFDRIGRNLTLTEAGSTLVPSARRILAELNHSKTLIAELGEKIGGKLSVGTSHHVGLHRLPPILRQCIQSHPSIELDLHFMDSEQACEKVEAGELELAVVTLPEHPHPKLTTQLIWPDPLAVMVGINHPLAERISVTLSELAEHPAIVPARGTVTRDILDHALLPYQLKLQVAMETNYMETIKMLVSVGIGWSTMPMSMLDSDLRAIQVEGLSLSRKLGIVLHRDRTLSHAAQAFIETIDAVIESERAPTLPQ